MLDGINQTYVLGSNLFYDIITSNNSNDSIDSSALNDKFINIVSVNNERAGLNIGSISNTDESLVLNSTLINNLNSGLEIFHNGFLGNYQRVKNSIFLNNNIGINHLFNFGDQIIYESLFLGNNNIGFVMDAHTDISVHDYFNFGGNGLDCNIINSGANVGFTGVGCTLAPPSTGNYNTGIDLSQVLVGKTTTNNSNTTAGVSANSSKTYG